jgi:hypothetical protein
MLDGKALDFSPEQASGGARARVPVRVPMCACLRLSAPGCACVTGCVYAPGCACVPVCMCQCAPACVPVCVHVCARVCACVCVCAHFSLYLPVCACGWGVWVWDSARTYGFQCACLQTFSSAPMHEVSRPAPSVVWCGRPLFTPTVRHRLAPNTVRARLPDTA